MTPRFKLYAPVATMALLFTLEQARAVEIEPMGHALQALLRSTKVGHKKISDHSDFYYVKGTPGHPRAVAAIEDGLYEPNCTHHWAIGLDPNSGRVTEVRLLEYSCQHAAPTKSASFLDQFKGKGPADAGKLDSQITTVAKATGTSNLATTAVKRAIVEYQKNKGQM